MSVKPLRPSRPLEWSQMDTIPPTFTLPIPVPHCLRRLISLVGGLIVLFGAFWWLQLPSIQPVRIWGLHIFIPAATFAALFVFAVITAMMDMRPRTRWLVVFAVIIAESLNCHTFELVAFADYLPGNPAVLAWLQDHAVLHFVIGLETVLAIHALLWPIRALLGWKVHWAEEAPFFRERLLTMWHLVGSVAMVAILLVHSGSQTNQLLLSQFGSLLSALAIGLPVLILATRRKHIAFWIPAALAGCMGLTLAEWGLTSFCPKLAAGGSGFSLWSWGTWNGTVAGTVLFIVLLLRWAGLKFHLPISRPEAALGRASIDEMRANSYGRRKFQFSLRSVFMLMTLLCLGPGSYIAWEREQCRRGSNILARIEEVLGKQNPTEERPAWLQAVLGNHRFRQLRLIYSKQTSIVDADLACLSGLPNIDSLLLDRTQVTGSGLDSLSHIHSLVTLQLSGTQVSDEGLVHFAPLTGLRHLILDKTKVTDAGLVHLSGLTNLRMLLLRDTNLTDDGLAHLSPLANLETLSVDNTEVTDAGLVHLMPLVNLQHLSLNNTAVTDAGLVHVTSLRKLSSLMLDNTGIGDTGLIHLPANLTCLGLNKTRVTDAGLVHLSGLNLEYLFLDNTSVGDAGLTRLSPDLKRLELANTKVTDAGLATISRLTRLENLDLSVNSITDAGLAKLEILPSLDTLVIKNTQVTKAGAAKLNKKLPALKIQR